MELRVSDVKQWLYCPRVVYWTRTVAVERPVTAKMTYGHETHAALDQLEKRRSFSQYRLSGAKRHFHLKLRSAALGLSGMLDLCLEAPEGLYPVEFKDTLGAVRQNHVAQLAAYAVLLEERYRRPAPAGFWISIPRDEVRAVAIPQSMKDRVRRVVEEIRVSIEEERLPAPADRWAKCTDCEFLRFCGDRYR